jgi:hypothetical protein
MCTLTTSSPGLTSTSGRFTNDYSVRYWGEELRVVTAHLAAAEHSCSGDTTPQFFSIHHDPSRWRERYAKEGLALPHCMAVLSHLRPGASPWPKACEPCPTTSRAVWSHVMSWSENAMTKASQSVESSASPVAMVVRLYFQLQSPSDKLRNL